jgi:hypothetical protein
MNYLHAMERTMRIVSLKEQPKDRLFWRDRTPAERLEALEFLRQQYMGPTHAEQRLQRICRVAKKA